MTRIKNVESGLGKMLLYIGAYLLCALIATIVVGIANSNLFWGEANQYGRVPIPGKKVLQLPSGDVQVNVAAALPGRGNATPEMPLPKLTLAVIPTEGQDEPTVSNDLGYSTNANDEYMIPLLGAIIGAVVFAVWFLIAWLHRSRKRGGEDPELQP
jgi:hypothetical protein